MLVPRALHLYDNFSVGAGTAPAGGQALAAQSTYILGISIQCDSGSSESIFVGNNYGQYREVAKGATLTLDITDLAKVYVKSTGGAGTYNYITGNL